MKTLFKIAGYLIKVYWFIFRPETYGVKGLLIKDGKVLLIKTSYNNVLALPGGGAKKGETAEEALKRELREETGIEVIKCHLVGEYESNDEYKRDHISLFYIDEFNEGVKKESLEIDSAQFYLLNNLPENVSNATLKRIKVGPNGVEHGQW